MGLFGKIRQPLGRPLQGIELGDPAFGTVVAIQIGSGSSVGAPTGRWNPVDQRFAQWRDTYKAPSGLMLPMTTPLLMPVLAFVDAPVLLRGHAPASRRLYRKRKPSPSAEMGPAETEATQFFRGWDGWFYLLGKPP